MNENFDDRVKEWFPLKNGNSLVKLQDDEGVDDFNKAKAINTMPSQFGSNILSHSKRLMNNVFREIYGFYSNNIYYGDTDSGYIHKKHWSTLVEKGYVGKTLGLGKNDYGDSGIFYAWFLAPKIKYCLVIDDYGVISAKRTFKGYSEEHRMIKLEEYISLSEGKTVSGRFSIDWTKTFEGIKIPRRIQNCSDCDNTKICSDCIIKPKTNCFNCEMERSCKSCLDLISQTKTYSTDINTSKRKPPNEKHQMLPYYEGVYEPKHINIDFESAKNILMKEDYKMIKQRNFHKKKFFYACPSKKINFLHVQSRNTHVKKHIQVHFTVALQFYVYVNMEFYIDVFLRELNLNIGMLSSSEAKKKARSSRGIITARG